MGDLRQQLCNFLMHEETSVDSIIAPYGLERVFHEIESLLETNDPEAVANVLGFVRDTNLYRHPFRDDFQARLEFSKIWSILRELLQAPNFSVRRNAVSTIGKLTCREKSILLAEAFPFYLEKDPINLPRLLMELVWLTNQWNWKFFEKVASAEHYLQRWSLCQILDDGGRSPETLQRFVGILTLLKNDVHPRVAAEANLRFERINVKLRPKLPKPEWRMEVKRIAALEPKITFERAAVQFMRERDDYSLTEFHEFVERLV